MNPPPAHDLPPVHALLLKHKHRYFRNARQWTDDCNKCSGNKLSVKLDDDDRGFRAHCEPRAPRRVAAGRDGSRRRDDGGGSGDSDGGGSDLPASSFASASDNGRLA